MKNIFTKTFLLLAFLGLNFNKAKSQWVTIPDANFVTWLTANYPSCMNGNQMDTTCAGIIEAVSIDISGLGILDIYGIEYFDDLTTLYSQNNSISTFSDLPNLLNTLNCSNNQLLAIPEIPNLYNLDCSNNQLSTLPVLPNSLIYLTCNNNQLMMLPNLPNSLQFLWCYNNSLQSLPVLPNSLLDLNFSGNNITSLFSLPNSLVNLRCSNNQLSSLPLLPNSLMHLSCSNNNIINLPVIPNSLIYLNCANNQIVNLPISLGQLGGFVCSNNLINHLPDLPNSIQNLQCDNNDITCFPVFPPSLTNPIYFNISGNPLTCLPNYVSAMNAATLSFPLCDASNLNGCTSASGILGKVFTENNINCTFDTTDLLLQNIKVNFFNPLNSQFGITYTAPNGVFNYPASAGTYFVLVDTLNKPYQANCLYPGIDSTIVTTVSNHLASNVNFDIKCRPGLDLNVQSVNHKDGLIFPGQPHTLQVMVGDASQWYGLNCANGSSGQVQITVTGPVTYNGVAMGALTPTINGNVYTFTIANFAAINNATDFQLLFTTNTNAQLGDQICVHVEVTPIAGDIYALNNIKDYCYSVVNSYDPNYKEVYPTGLPPLFQDWLTYTIHFQNLGTAPAINIRLLDTLDNNLDAETFEVINYSHFNTVTLMNGILDFRFPNILLLDSASNPAGSQGFVQYRIKPLANLPVGTQIENTAHIYFDYNPAVITNTTVNNFTTTVGNTSISENNKLFVYPNPSTGVFTISSAANIEVYNIVGELILFENNATSIDITAAPKGMYFVKLNGGKIEKLIKN
jgi:uncharacterized repeat protein (TIGR01451 family)